MTEDIVHLISQHYEHAREKHPHFADVIACDRAAVLVAPVLAVFRKRLETEHPLFATTVFDCEYLEVQEAIANKDWTQVRYEIYDAIAVLLRMDDMVRAEMERTGNGRKGGE